MLIKNTFSNYARIGCLSFLWCLPLYPSCQVLAPVRQELVSTDADTDDDENQNIISHRGLNAFFGKKMAYYLSGSEDVSMFKTYFILDSDGALFLAYNSAPQENDKMLRYLSTWGIKAKIENGLSAFFSKGETQGDIGISYRGTIFFSGSVKYDDRGQNERRKSPSPKSNGPQWNKIKQERTKIRNSLTAKSFEEERDFESSIFGVSNAEEQRGVFLKNKLKEYRDAHAEMEADALADKEAFNKVSKAWVSFFVYGPITPTKYEVASDLNSKSNKKYFSPWEFSISANGFIEGSLGKLFLSGGAGLKLNNSIAAELGEINEIETTAYKSLSGGDTIRLANIESSKLHIGKYRTFATPQIKFQIVAFPRLIDFDQLSFGVSAQLEINDGLYNPFNLEFGIPIRLDSNEDGKPVNIEFTGQFFDFKGSLTKKAPKENFTIGISVGLPFNSIIK